MKKDKDSLIEDKRKGKAQRAHTRHNSKRHIPLVSLLFWCKMVAVRCIVWSPALQTGSQTKIHVLVIFLQFYILRMLLVFSCF